MIVDIQDGVEKEYEVSEFTLGCLRSSTDEVIGSLLSSREIILELL
jgi:hypothetical protein